MFKVLLLLLLACMVNGSEIRGDRLLQSCYSNMYTNFPDSCCLLQCGIRCSSSTTCYITGGSASSCFCSVFQFQGYLDEYFFFYLGALVLINLLIALSIVYCCLLPSLRRQESHLPPEFRIVQRKQCLAVGLSFCLGLFGSLVAYFMIKSDVRSNNNNYMMRSMTTNTVYQVQPSFTIAESPSISKQHEMSSVNHAYPAATTANAYPAVTPVNAYPAVTPVNAYPKV